MVISSEVLPAAAGGGGGEGGEVASPPEATWDSASALPLAEAAISVGMIETVLGTPKHPSGRLNLAVLQNRARSLIHLIER